MKRHVIVTAFVIVALVHVAVPAWMIARQEVILREGRAYKFRTAPVDPYDAFRGRYVWLSYEQNRARWNGRTEPRPGGPAYALIEEDKNGFAVVREVSPQPPEAGNYVKVEHVYPGWGTNSGSVHFALPFDRYYMEETKAPAAERAYREHSDRRGQTNHNTYAVIRIKDGDAALENLYVDGKPIAEFIHEAGK